MRGRTKKDFQYLMIASGLKQILIMTWPMIFFIQGDHLKIKNEMRVLGFLGFVCDGVDFSNHFFQSFEHVVIIDMS